MIQLTFFLRIEYCCHICFGAAQALLSSLDSVRKCLSGLVMNCSPPCNPHLTDKTLPDFRYIATIMADVQISYIP